MIGTRSSCADSHCATRWPVTEKRRRGEEVKVLLKSILKRSKSVWRQLALNTVVVMTSTTTITITTKKWRSLLRWSKRKEGIIIILARNGQHEQRITALQHCIWWRLAIKQTLQWKGRRRRSSRKTTTTGDRREHKIKRRMVSGLGRTTIEVKVKVKECVCVTVWKCRQMCPMCNNPLCTICRRVIVNDEIA